MGGGKVSEGGRCVDLNPRDSGGSIEDFFEVGAFGGLCAAIKALVEGFFGGEVSEREGVGVVIHDDCVGGGCGDLREEVFEEAGEG